MKSNETNFLIIVGIQPHRILILDCFSFMVMNPYQIMPRITALYFLSNMLPMVSASISNPTLNQHTIVTGLSWYILIGFPNQRRIIEMVKMFYILWMVTIY